MAIWGGLFSPNDPIVRASGDVAFDSYEGTSLHILAGGSVTVGDIFITGADTLGNAIVETVTLSDGSSVSINGTTQATLDIRAGTTAFGAAGLTPNLPPGFDPAPPATGGTGTSANITIGSIFVESTIGTDNPVVLLTNQSAPNLGLPGGTIAVEAIDLFGNDGRVTIDSRTGVTLGDIFAEGLDAPEPGSSSTGGTVNILANDSIESARSTPQALALGKAVISPFSIAGATLP
ncbi:MAG: hypothetical protein HC881_22550 [Leptolyngbyaceae cyanobacterium SL_7_1]|nr:hypothetical protein [Leptolyngbyaceae cyanobacterium SL_7_1]